MIAAQRRTLVVAPNWLGDCLMAQPLLMRIAARLPGAAIDVVAIPAVAPVLRRMPEVARIIEADFRHGSLGLKARSSRTLEWFVANEEPITVSNWPRWCAIDP